MHHEIQRKNKEEYNYLSENIRIGENRWKRVRVYIGKGKLSKKELKDLISKNEKKLQEKVDKIKKTYDSLLSLLTNRQVEDLEKIKKTYQKSIKKTDRNLWQKHYEAFVTKFTYNTNAIEGSSLDLMETGLILFENIAPEGKELWEIDWAKNHKDAFDYMISYKDNLARKFILTLHKKLMYNILWKYAGKFRDVQVAIRGVDFLPPPPEKIHDEFKTLMRWYGSNKNKYHPVVVAAYFHFVFESIHPFRDGNGRVGRLLLNFMLNKNGLPMIDIKNTNRIEYYKSLQEAQENKNFKPLVDIIVKYIKESKIWI